MHSRLNVAILLVVLVATQTMADSRSVTLSPSIPFSTPELAAAARSQTAPACASDGNGYFAAWIDERGGVRGTRVDEGGTPLDPTGIAITSRETFGSPLVTFDGTSYVVFFGIGMTRVGLDGRVLAPDRQIALPRRFYPGINHVVTNNRVFLVSWIDSQSHGPSEFHIAILGLEGELRRDETGQALALATDGDHFVAVALASNGQLVARSYDSSGEIVESDIPIEGASGSTYAVGIAWNGDHYLLARNDGESLWTQLLDREGHSLGAPKAFIANPVPFALASAGGEFLLCLVAERATPDSGVTTDVYATHLHADGTPAELEPFPIAVGDEQSMLPVVASNDSGYLLCWQESAIPNYGDWGMWGATLGTSGPARQRALLALSAAEQRSPALASTSTEMLAAWRESRSRWYVSDPGIVVARFDERGVARDSKPVVVAPNGTDFAVASDGTGYFVVWREGNYNVSASMIPPSGEPDGVVILDHDFGEGAPALAFGGGVYLAAWQAGDIDPAILVARIGPDGTLLDSPLRLANGLAVSVAFDGTDFIVVHDEDSAGLFVERLTPSLEHVDSEMLTADSFSPSRSGIDCHDGTCLAAWKSWSMSRGRFEILGAIVRKGAMSYPFPLSAADAPDIDAYERPSVAWCGGSFAVAWSEGLNAEAEVAIRRVDPTGAYASDVFRLTSGPDANRSPDIVASPRGTLSVAWERTSPEPEYGGVPRAFFRFVADVGRSRPTRRR